MNKDQTVILLQSSLPDYRQKFLEQLQVRLGDSFKAYAGAEHFEATVRTDVNIGKALVRVKNVYVFRRRLLWQTAPLGDLVKAKVVVLELNPRILTVWIVLMIRAMLKKRSILWGHAWSRKGRKHITNKIRPLMWEMADALLMYTGHDAKEIQELTSTPVIGASNAIYSVSQRANNITTGSAINIIYVGRLVAKKKPELLVRAFLDLLELIPAKAKLILVGDGPERALLENMAKLAPHRIELKGHLNNVDLLSDLYSDALVSVSPGYAGLSLTQSLWFGVPMIIAKDEPHAPEIEAVQEGVNAAWFESNSVESLKKRLLEFYADAQNWRGRRVEISNMCVHQYSAERMADSFLAAIRGVPVSTS